MTTFKNKSELSRSDGGLWWQVNSYTNNDVAVYKKYINLRQYLQIILKFVNKNTPASLFTDVVMATNSYLWTIWWKDYLDVVEAWLFWIFKFHEVV